MNLVTVIISTYKRPSDISRAIESVINQSYKNIEIIVVDDNGVGTDYQLLTENIVKKYKRVLYLPHKKNMGGSFARNTGIRNSHGDYLTFLDDDDEMLPDKIMDQVNCLDKLDDSWGACYTAYTIIKEKGHAEKSVTNYYGDVYVRALMRTLYICGGSNLFVRRSVVERLGGFDVTFKRNQDLEFLVRITEISKLAYINKNDLIIHTEIREVKRSFEQIDEVSLFYLDKFSSKISNLSEKDRRRVITVISLDRARVALSYRLLGKSIRIIIENRVSIINVIKYALYMLKRIITKKSYGFYI